MTQVIHRIILNRPLAIGVARPVQPVGTHEPFNAPLFRPITASLHQFHCHQAWPGELCGTRERSQATAGV